MKNRRKAKPPAPALPDPSPETKAAIGAARARMAQRRRPPAVRVEQGEGQALKIGPTHSDGHGWQDHTLDAFGTTSGDFANQSLLRLVNAHALKERAPTAEEINAAHAVMAAVGPQNELEAIMAEQIYATHLASMDFLRRARMNAGEYLASAEAYANMATKLSRTMAAHTEALAKLRSGGKQTCEVRYEVRYVHVAGNAVVSDHAQAMFGGGSPGNGGQPQATALPGFPPPALAAVLSQNSPGLPLPVPSGAGPEALPDARWSAGLGSPEGTPQRHVPDGSMDPGNGGGPPADA